MQTVCVVSFLEVIGVAVMMGHIVAPEFYGQGAAKGSMQELENRVWKRGSHWRDRGALENQSESGVTPPHWTLCMVSSLWRAKAGGKEENRITS